MKIPSEIEIIDASFTFCIVLIVRFIRIFKLGPAEHVENVWTKQYYPESWHVNTKFF